jgi:pimeloyl-ACP methyl ester carboxylesterase
MPFVNQLYYSAHNPADISRPPVVLIHGAGGNHLYWPPQIRRLAHERVFALDLSGHGKSEGLGRERIEAYAAQVIEFLMAIGLPSAVMAGHSMGGAVALQIALESPRSVLGLCLVGSGARLRVSPEILSAISDDLTLANGIEMLVNTSFSPQSSQRLKQLAALRMQEMRPSVLRGDLLACNAFSVMDRLGEIEAPTLILCGAQDAMTPPKYSEFLHAKLRGSRLEIIPSAGHMVMLERPGEVAAALSRYLGELEYLPGT